MLKNKKDGNNNAEMTVFIEDDPKEKTDDSQKKLIKLPKHY